MAGVESSLADLRRVLAGQTTGSHEVKRVGNAFRQGLIEVGLRALLDKLQVPLVHLMQVGKAALGKSAEQVQGRGRLGVALHHARGVGGARSRREFDTVNDIAAIAGQCRVALSLRIRGARLGELARHATDFDHRHPGFEGEHDGHLQDDPEQVADIVGGEVLEALGAIATLHQESSASRNIGERGAQAAGLAGKN